MSTLYDRLKAADMLPCRVTVQECTWEITADHPYGYWHGEGVLPGMGVPDLADGFREALQRQLLDLGPAASRDYQKDLAYLVRWVLRNLDTSPLHHPDFPKSYDVSLTHRAFPSRILDMLDITFTQEDKGAWFQYVDDLWSDVPHQLQKLIPYVTPVRASHE